jgi:hypothetical protein
MIDSSGFMPGVWCGAIFGAAVMLLIVSLIFEGSQRKEERQLRRFRQVWIEGLSVATASIVPLNPQIEFNSTVSRRLRSPIQE